MAPSDYPIVNAPSDLTAAMGPSGLDLTWSDNSDNETDFNVRFTDPSTGAIVKTWHAEGDTTSITVPVVATAEEYGIVPGSYNVTMYAAGYYVFDPNNPELPSTNLWSGPSNTVSVEVTMGTPPQKPGKGGGHGKGGNPNKP